MKDGTEKTGLLGVTKSRSYTGEDDSACVIGGASPSVSLDMAMWHCHADRSLSGERHREKQQAKRKLYIASFVCLAFMIGEIVGGYLAGSLAIMTDAAHLLTDFASFLISLFSLWVSSRPATKNMNFGWFRAEILGALLSVLSIWVVTGVLVYLAVQRIVSDDFSIDGEVMLITAACAVGVNIIMAVTLHQPGSFHGHSHGGGGGGGHGHSHGHGHGHGGGKESEQNVNVRAAFIHVLGDLLQSLGVLIAAIIIFFKPNLKIADPICTFIFSVIVLATTISILRDVLRVLMEGTPKGIDFNEVKASLLAVPGVRDLHSLHLWALTMNQPVLSVHIAIEESVDPHLVLSEATIALHKKFGFYTTTIQVERYMDEMKNCTDCQDPSD